MRAHENPFRVSEVSTLRYRGHEDGAAVLGRLRDSGLRGAIVGPPGSGKSTLLRELADALTLDGRDVRVVRFDEPRLLLEAIVDTNAVLFVDGAERIPQPARSALVTLARRVVVTTHDPFPGLSVLARCSTTPELLADLLADLGVGAMVEGEVDRIFRESRGDLRRAFRVLYDASTQDFGGAFRAR